MLRDLRFALRVLVRQPGFAVAAILTLALGIGANTAIFSVAWQVLLKPLPYPAADRLVTVWEAYGPQDTTNPVAAGNYHDWVSQARSFEAIAAYTYFNSPATLTESGDPEQVQLRYVTGGYFRVFGMAPLAGRTLTDDDATSTSSAIVLSEGLWRRRFGGDRSIVGRTIRFGGQPYLVAGVMPAAFQVAGGQVDGWAALGFSPENAASRGAHYLGAVGRLLPNVTLTQAIADVKAIAQRAAQQYPQTNKSTSSTAKSIAAERGGTSRQALTMLAGASAFVLLIACANLASLQLARSAARQREFGIRAALGASRPRLAAQVVLEALMVSVAGAAAGLLVSRWLLATLAAVAPAGIDRAATAPVEWADILYALGLAVASALVFALAPAWRTAARTAPWMGQRASTGDRSSARLRSTLVTVEIALAVVLLTGTTLLVTSLARVLRVDPGFDPSGVLTFDVSVPTAPRMYPDRAALLTRVIEQVESVPGVTGACAINVVPFDENFNMTYVPDGQDQPVNAFPRNVTAKCFDVLRIRPVAGRLFTDREPTRVGIVTEAFAHAAWPNQPAVGRRVHLGVKDGALIEIIGVVADSRQRSLESRPYPQFYEVMSAQSAFPPSRILARVAGAPESVFADVRRAVHRVDANQPVARLRTLETAVGSTVSGRWFDLSLVSGFSIVAVILAAIGIYGLLAQIVAQRTAEIGIRLALGASPRSVVGLVMWHAWLSTAVGVGLGSLGAMFASRLLRQAVFGVSPTEPRVYIGVAIGLALTALLAAWIPARRAANIDPILALRS